MFKAVCRLGLEGIVSKKLAAPYRSGPSKPGSSQKSESYGGYTGNRRDFLRERSVSILGVKRTLLSHRKMSADPKLPSHSLRSTSIARDAPRRPPTLRFLPDITERN